MEQIDPFLVAPSKQIVKNLDILKNANIRA